MAEETTPTQRKPAEIQQEYGALCAQIGEKTFQIRTLQSDIVRIHARFDELNAEMLQAIAAQNAAAAEVASGETDDGKSASTN